MRTLKDQLLQVELQIRECRERLAHLEAERERLLAQIRAEEELLWEYLRRQNCDHDPRGVEDLPTEAAQAGSAQGDRDNRPRAGETKEGGASERR